MTADSTSTSTSEVDPSLKRAVRRRPRRRRWVIATVVVVAAITVVVGGGNPFARKHASHSRAKSASSVSTSLASVTQRDLSEQTPVSATLGYAAGNRAIVYQGGGSSGTAGSAGSGGGGSSGTFTKLPSVGTVLKQGQVMYRVNNNPVVLLYGTTPAYRSLSEGTISDTSGPDVAELNADLVALDYATHTQIPARSDKFSSETKAALEKLQHHFGLKETGTLKLGQATFLPSAARVTSVSASAGGPAQTGSTVLATTSTTRQVKIALDTAQQTYVKVGNKVTITLPNNQTTPGVVSSVGKVARSSSGSGSGSSSGSSSNPTITVLIRPTNPAATGTWDQAPVNVTITTATVRNVLAVPVTALLVKGGGGYAVEVVAADGTHHLVDVTLGVFDDAEGLVQVTGPGLAAGQRVVVPTT